MSEKPGFWLEVNRPATSGWPRESVRFEIISELVNVQTFARDRGIRELARLRRFYGAGSWRKRKAFAWVRPSDGAECKAEIHWYEATGIGRRQFKIKRLFDTQ